MMEMSFCFRCESLPVILASLISFWKEVWEMKGCEVS